MTETDDKLYNRYLQATLQICSVGRPYKDALVGLAHNILLNREDAEEVAHDALMKAYKSLQTFRADAKFSTWLYRILVNTALNKKKRLHVLSRQNVAAPTHLQDVRTVQFDRKIYIDNALKSIASNERLCITLFYLNELSVNEIADATGFSVANIKILLHRGRKSLYKALHTLLHDEIAVLRQSL